MLRMHQRIQSSDGLVAQLIFKKSLVKAVTRTTRGRQSRRRALGDSRRASKERWKRKQIALAIAHGEHRSR